jgi:alkylation response protein AidB-like acyl-CoA dehydrogenase
VDGDAVVGGGAAIGAAWAPLRITGALERLIVAAMALGLASTIVERAVDFAKSRQQFGQPIAKFQAIQHMLVEMRTCETGMRLFVDNALNGLERSGYAGAEIPMAKYVCSEQLQDIAALGMRVMGGRAFFRFDEMERYYREAPFSLFAGGTVEIQKMLIARAMGLP